MFTATRGYWFNYSLSASFKGALYRMVKHSKVICVSKVKNRRYDTMVLKKKTTLKKVEKKEVIKPIKKDRLSNYSDEYTPEFKPLRLLVRECPSQKDPSRMLKQYLDVSCRRYGEDGLPFVFCTMYQESETYTGYLKGKTIYFPLEMLYDVNALLEEFSEECEKHNIS